MSLILLSALGNHLWQSTLFAIAAGLLALALKKNQARTRYWIWLAASVKFLIPFSFLIDAGSQLSWPSSTGAIATVIEPSVPAFVIAQVAEPFTSSPVKTVASTAVTKSSSSLTAALPAVVLVIWACGSVAMLWRWWTQWVRVRAVVQQAVRLSEGREFDRLQRLRETAGMRRPIAIMLSTAAMEPSIFGIFRTILAWPAGLSPRLMDEELDAIILHELSHVTRRDNLTAVMHMLVEVIFWFHPLVWWLGTRLVDEREKACDEDVIRWGGASHAYAEGILKVCEFCLESPMVCAAGVTGSNLKKRIEEIMRNRLALKLSFSRVLLLAAAAIAAVTGPIVIGAVNSKVDRTRSTVQSSEATNQAAPAVQPETAQSRTETQSESAAEAAPGADSEDRPAAVESRELQTASQDAQPAPQNPPEVRDTFEMSSVTPSSPPPPGARRGGPGARGGGPGLRGLGPRGGGPGIGVGCTGGPAQIEAGRFTVTNKTLYSLITMAYGMNCLSASVTDLLSEGPEWVRSDQFDIQALIPEGTPTYTAQEFAAGSAPKLQRMLQNLLADRFKLALHGEMKEMPVYVLRVGQQGTRPPSSAENARGAATTPTGLPTTKLSMPDLATRLMLVTRKPVLDRTGLTGEFDVDIRFASLDDNGPTYPSVPSILVASDGQLSLVLEPSTAALEVVIIDHAEKPSEN